MPVCNTPKPHQDRNHARAQLVVNGLVECCAFGQCGEQCRRGGKDAAVKLGAVSTNAWGRICAGLGHRLHVEPPEIEKGQTDRRQKPAQKARDELLHHLF